MFKIRKILLSVTKNVDYCQIIYKNCIEKIIKADKNK